MARKLKAKRGARAPWFAVRTDATPRKYVVTTRAPRQVPGARHAYGPYPSRGDACTVGQFHARGIPPHGCDSVDPWKTR